MSTRRQLLVTAGLLSIVGLPGCATSSASIAAAEAQVISDVKIILSAIPSIVNAIQLIAPKAIVKGGPVDNEITSIVSSLQQSTSTLTVTTPAADAASVLQKVTTGINTVLQLIGAVLPAAAIAFPPLAPYVVIYDTTVALIPIIEAFINNNLPASVTTVAAEMPLVAIDKKYTPSDARRLLSELVH